MRLFEAVSLVYDGQCNYCAVYEDGSRARCGTGPDHIRCARHQNRRGDVPAAFIRRLG